MKTIAAFDGRICNLSDEIYVITEGDESYPFRYKPGNKVRLISGIENNDTPGFHFNHNYLTVCRENAEIAEFVGFKREFVKRLA